MDKLKEFVIKHFEKIILLLIVAAVAAINFSAVPKYAFLQFFYLPILVAGYVLGRKYALLIAIFCILTVSVFIVLSPQPYIEQAGNVLNLTLSLLSWGSFLILAAIAVGTLYEQKEKKIRDLKTAYIGVLEILTKYLEATDEYTQGHSIRVARYAADTAGVMGLSKLEIENIKAAALLHDIGKIEVSTDLIRKAAALTGEEKELVRTHSEKGARILFSVGEVLREAVPLVLAHHEYFLSGKGEDKGKKDFKNIPLGARIIAVGDAFDAIVTDRPYRKGKPPWQAIQEIEKESGRQFDPQVVKAFEKIISP